MDHNTLLGVSLPILNMHDDEEANYKDENNLTAGNKQSPNMNDNFNANIDDVVEQTRNKILQFLNEYVMN